MSNDYSIRPLCYAHVDLPREFFGGVPIHSGEGVSPSPMIYVLITSKADSGDVHYYLVDAGFRSEKWIHRFGFYDYETPDKVLAKVGVEPEQIEKIFLTHMHFDHANNLPAFENADVYVQWSEFEGWTKALGLPPLFTPLGEESWITSSFDREDLQMYGGLLRDNKLHFVGDGEEILPGFRGNLSKDGHTFGTQWFLIETSNGAYVVAGDAVMWYSNIEEMWPPGYSNGSGFNSMMTYGQIYQALEGELNRIVPGHDTLLFERHPSWKVGPNEIAEVHVASWDVSLKPN